jgi:hypothetical protein
MVNGGASEIFFTRFKSLIFGEIEIVERGRNDLWKTVGNVLEVTTFGKSGAGFPAPRGCKESRFIRR